MNNVDDSNLLSDVEAAIIGVIFFVLIVAVLVSVEYPNASYLKPMPLVGNVQ